MQAFEDLLILLKTGNKNEAIDRYAERMHISREEAKKAIESLLLNTNSKLAVKKKGYTQFDGSRQGRF